MLEHGTVYLKLQVAEAHKYVYNPYSRVSEVVPEEVYDERTSYNPFVYVTTNSRVIFENEWGADLKYMCDKTDYHSERITLSFIISNGLAREFTRHRKFSFAQESTRYCNYSKDKFNNEISYIIPQWIKLNPGVYYYDINFDIAGDGYIECDDNIVSKETIFLRSLLHSEEKYKFLVSEVAPQNAREVLPLATKTQLIMTGFKNDWDHFFSLRCAKNAHPDAQYIANKAKEEIYGNESNSY
jgi:thymidylate synthase (FAD)